MWWFSCHLSVWFVAVKLAHNGFGLGEEADFEALNCQSSTKFDTK
jgi:hypothetical protein